MIIQNWRHIMSNSTNESKYFDLHTTGIGYLNRIREVKPRKGNPFMAVTVAALKGCTTSAEYAFIDCNVVGAEAEKLIRRSQEAVVAGKKVLVSFRIGDIWADTFTYGSGEKQGQTGVSLKGRLLYLAWIKVDGETVYQAPAKEEAPASSESQALDTSAAVHSEAPAPVESTATVPPVAATPSAAQPAKPARAARGQRQAA
ncbi:Periplasmic protein TonB, link inner and outer membrane [Pseudomonas syringae pv. maculicola]|uniref:Periplasmic protein TonB, link inner and outer membrane n=3 Tax=Pseudomonas syringae group TaxID=136849 RepID=A0A3M6CF92_PSEYM|nr:Periplasmic protein TonB, link inner and outer membrane [Pseudomonas syringae pv. maculicola]RMV42323.1 Periplasmic protein TonB, link inner and outer membrane [Pseudomonas syringae pv. maculicola]